MRNAPITLEELDAAMNLRGWEADLLPGLRVVGAVGLCALFACARGAFAAPLGYVEVFETDNGMSAFVHPDVRNTPLSLESGRSPLTLALADVWWEQGPTHTAMRTAFRCDSPGSSFSVWTRPDGRLFRYEKANNAKRGTLGYSLWDFACTRARGVSGSPDVTATPPSGNWKYWSMKDPEYGVAIRMASAQSVGYAGSLMIRMTPDGGRTVVIGASGAINCPDPCKIKAEVDGVASDLDARPPARMANMLYFSRETLPASLVAASRRVDMEINLGKDGWRVMTFNTEGFDWSRMK